MGRRLVVEGKEGMDRQYARFVRWLVPVVAGTLWLGAPSSARQRIEPFVFAAGARGQPAEPAQAGRALEMWVDRASGVTSAWLSNGVLIHHKEIKSRPKAPVDPEQRAAGGGEGRRRDRGAPEVAIWVTVAGAELLETGENRGVSDAAVAAAWTPRSVRSMKAGELEAYLDGCGAGVRCYGGSDSFMLSVSTTALRAGDALRGVRLMLCEPVVDGAELQGWQERTIKQIEERERAGASAFDGVTSALFGPLEARARRPRIENVRAITPAAAQGWLDRAVGGAETPGMPMEVAIVGNISVDGAIRLAEVYFGSLPSRPRIGEATFAERRILARAERPPEVIAAPNWKGDPLVFVGFVGADIRDLADHRGLVAAAKVLSNRLERRLPAEQNEGERADARAISASVYPGCGLFLATTHARTGHEAAASRNIHNLLEDVARNGPTPEELSSATQELGDSAAKMLADPVYWARQLSLSVYHGVRASDISGAERAYRDMQPEMIIGALKKYCTPERSIKLIVTPAERVSEDKPAER